MNIVQVTDDAGRVVELAWLKRAEGVHRQLRTALPPDYESKMRRVFAGGARMCVATEGGAVLGVAVYRISENTFEGLHLYVDDCRGSRWPRIARRLRSTRARSAHRRTSSIFGRGWW